MLAMLSPACYVSTEGSGVVERDSRTVDLKGAKSVQVEIEMGAGELIMRGGAAQLVDADFRYRGRDGKPEVHYDVSGARRVNLDSVTRGNPVTTALGTTTRINGSCG